MRKILTTVSEKYGICSYGVNGMEIIEDGKSVRVFNRSKTRLENWESAVRWMESSALWLKKEEVKK